MHTPNTIDFDGECTLKSVPQVSSPKTSSSLQWRAGTYLKVLFKRNCLIRQSHADWPQLVDPQHESVD